MECEVNSIVESLTDASCHKLVNLSIYEGAYGEAKVFVVKSGIGKVNAALCAQILIDRFGVDVLINTGIAGGIAPGVKVGDVVVSTDAIEHDFNARAVGLPQGKIPDQEVCRYEADSNLLTLIKQHIQTLEIPGNVIYGTVASGDIFVASKKTKNNIYDTFGAKCCEMEGAAIAHVAHMNDIPFVIVRSISDSASDDANELYQDFEQYAADVSMRFTLAILENLRKS